ncbi:hypothetical protein [Rugamonas sp. DEMB1]|uniref:hypothetical protein n=1 Tax=Rugamonas sp. DEMB1 TaxID=3039386 RepID=UPI00244C7EA7|nr:hypothetical protein [Rugamonas sp. DEMB1]WGG50669.1 hypothetical protein QC826_30545 [Rugamonas sp. DEMB1]
MAADNWTPVTDQNLRITPGSPLDFSHLLPPGPAGSLGRLIKGKNGNLVFADRPDKKAALNCGAITWGSLTGGYPDHQKADEYVAQLKLHGYNLIRFHFVDLAMIESQPTTNGFHPQRLENFHYFLRALKKAGIYWIMDMMTADDGTLGNVKDRWNLSNDLKFRVNLDNDEVAKQSWRDQVNALYNTVYDPETGNTILNDPALVAVVLVNEGGINFLNTVRKNEEKGIFSKKYDARLQAPFNAFLKAKYQTQANLQKAWEIPLRNNYDPLGGDEDLDKGTIKLPTGILTYSNRMTAFQSFVTQQEIKTVNWMSDYVRQLGFPGLITSLNNGNSLEANRARASLELIDAHAYVENIGAYQVGLQSNQKSTIDQLGDKLGTNNFIFDLTSTRHGGKPFAVTEYGQVFFNQYRFEASALVPSIAALQGWDFTCLHSEGPIDLELYQDFQHKKSIQPYAVGIDPVLRAGETLSALLFMRGDVKPSPNRVTVNYPSGTEYAPSSGVYPMTYDLKMLGLVTGVELNYPDLYPTTDLPAVPGIRLALTQKVNNLPNDRILELIQAGILSPKPTDKEKADDPDTNLNNAWSGVYHSDTKELLTDKPKQRFTVRTARTQAVTTARAVNATNPLDVINLGALNVASIDGPALLAASTLNEGALKDSDKILLIFATDAVNTDMTFEEPTIDIAPRGKLKTLGTKPALIRQGIASASITLAHKTPMRLVALDLKGDRQGPRRPDPAGQRHWHHLVVHAGQHRESAPADHLLPAGEGAVVSMPG